MWVYGRIRGMFATTGHVEIAALALVLMVGAPAAGQAVQQPLRTIVPTITVKPEQEPEDPQTVPLSVTAV